MVITFFSFWGMHLLFYFITVGGNDLAMWPGLASGKPLSAFVSCSPALLKRLWRREGAPKGQKTVLRGQQSHFWNHHRSHGLLTFPQSSSGERWFHWLPRGWLPEGCRDGSSRHTPPSVSGSHSLKQFTADKNILCLNVTREQTELRFVRTIRNGTITIFLFTAQGGEEIE